MPASAHIRAPQTMALINRVNAILTARGLSREQFREKLNELLTPPRRLKTNHSGLVQIVRWLDPTNNRWSEPKGEIVLAMKEFVDRN